MATIRAVIILWLGFCGAVAAAELSFSVGGEAARVSSLAMLKGELETHAIEMYDPHYEEMKRYAGFDVGEVLTWAYGEQWQQDADADITFMALDGYQAVTDVGRLQQGGGYIVFQDRDLEAGVWNPIGRRQQDPAPFYLVWTGEQQNTANGFPWPWQLVAVDWIRFQDRYPAVYPENVTRDSEAYHGYAIFKERCFRCHAMSGQGGKIGPDLNAPRSIVEYRSQAMIKAFIRQPSSYRHTQMPDHLDLSERDLDALLEYFWHQDKNWLGDTDTGIKAE